MNTLPSLDTKNYSKPPASLSPDPPTAFRISQQDACHLLKRQNIRKASGSDSMSPSFLKVCVKQLTPIHTHIFKKITGPVWSSLMFRTLHNNSGAKIIFHLRINWLQTCNANICGQEVLWEAGDCPAERHHRTGWTPCNLPNKANRTVEDAVIMWLNNILQHLDHPGCDKVQAFFVITIC